MPASSTGPLPGRSVTDDEARQGRAELAVTDEDGLRALEPGDVSIEVGDGGTAARLRVPDAAGALAVLQHLADLLG